MIPDRAKVATLVDRFHASGPVTLEGCAALLAALLDIPEAELDRREVHFFF